MAKNNLATRLRKEADRIEDLLWNLSEAKAELARERKLMSPSPRKGVPEPWDARKGPATGGYSNKSGTTGMPCQKVTGRAWETLCVCPNNACAELVARALNFYLKHERPEIMSQEEDQVSPGNPKR